MSTYTCYRLSQAKACRFLKLLLPSLEGLGLLCPLMNKELGDWIADRRRMLGMRRREDLVAKTRLGLSTILRAEHGKAVSRSSLKLIATALGVSPDALISWSEGLIGRPTLLLTIDAVAARPSPRRMGIAEMLAEGAPIGELEEETLRIDLNDLEATAMQYGLLPQSLLDESLSLWKSQKRTAAVHARASRADAPVLYDGVVDEDEDPATARDRRMQERFDQKVTKGKGKG